MTTRDPSRPAARFLEGSVLFTFVAHAFGMLTMALFLLPGMPGGPHANLLDRAAYVASHPWLWRAGWFGWQLTALSDLLIAIALLRTSWIPKVAAVFTLLVTIGGIIPDQFGQAMWIARGVDLAQRAIESGTLDTYAQFEASAFCLIAGWGTVGYLLGALGWTWCFAAAGTWGRGLTWLSIVLWSLFAVATVPIFLPDQYRPRAIIVSAGNAIAFVLLMIWLLWVAERVWARSRTAESHGRYAPWRHPRGGMVGRIFDFLAASHLVRAFGERMPVIGFASDITDVVYVNYLVDADRLARFVPNGLDLQRLGPEGRYALFTFLTYRHGHFGPTMFGPLRRFLPSPVQSSWRIYVSDPRTQMRGVYFVTTCISRTPHALAARILSEGMPMHVPQSAEVPRDTDGTMHVRIDPGNGSAPDVRATLRPTSDRTLPPPWNECFADYHDFLAYCVPQDRALTCQPWYSHVTRQEISLGIPLNACEPLSGEVESDAARKIAGDAKPICFRVAKVSFRFLGQSYDRIQHTSSSTCSAT